MHTPAFTPRQTARHEELEVEMRAKGEQLKRAEGVKKEKEAEQANESTRRQSTVARSGGSTETWLIGSRM